VRGTLEQRELAMRLFVTDADTMVPAIDHGKPGIYYVVDDDPAPVPVWLAPLAQELSAA
jgi:2-alkyl-3-oxoalkanoate reductase